MSNYRELIGKKAFSEENELLGKITRIDKLPGKTIKKIKPYIIIQIRRFLNKNLHIPIDLDLLKEVSNGKVILKISKKDFDKEKERVERIMIERESFKEYPKMTSFDTTRMPRRKGD